MFTLQNSNDLNLRRGWGYHGIQDEYYTSSLCISLLECLRLNACARRNPFGNESWRATTKTQWWHWCNAMSLLPRNRRSSVSFTISKSSVSLHTCNILHASSWHLITSLSWHSWWWYGQRCDVKRWLQWWKWWLYRYVCMMTITLMALPSICRDLHILPEHIRVGISL